MPPSKPIVPRLSHNTHPSPPYDDDSLTKCVYKSQTLLTEDQRWRQDFLGLHFRTICLSKAQLALGFKGLSKIMHMGTMHPLDSALTPDSSRVMNFATRAGIAALMLYRRTSAPLNSDQAGDIGWAQAYYKSHVGLKADKLDVDDSVDDLRLLAAVCTFRAGASAPNRDWPVLIKDDPRWCLVSCKEEWPALMNAYPQTRSYLELFSIACTLVPPAEALHHSWYSQNPIVSIALPDLDCTLSGP